MPTSLDLIGAHPWRSAVFTTYSLSLSFFEAIVLDQLIRGGARGAVILSDVDGVRGALSEHGARRVGREYDIEPISVSSGVFHPKLSVLIGQHECHLLVGSGNLTFGGWGGNFEVFEHLHSGFAAEAIRDASEFFASLANAPRVRHGARSQCLETAASLRESVTGVSGSGKIRLIHSLQRSILDQISEFAEELGGAKRVIIASPYWQGGEALDGICAALRTDRAYVHSHPGGIVRGSFGSNWPRNSKGLVDPVCIDAFNIEGDRRLLHAKVFEIVCNRGRLIISGSANATNAALGEGQNVEACLVRIETGKVVGWKFSPAEPPEESLMSDDENDDNEEACGVLRATLDSDTVYGQVLHPALKGRAEALLVTSDGAQKLGSVQLNDQSQFSIHVKGLELKILQGQRCVLAIETETTRVEGFISVTAFSEISRRSGSLASRLIALLAGNETPSDLAAIMSWICEDPNVLSRNLLSQKCAVTARPDKVEPNRTIHIDDLRSSLDIDRHSPHALGNNQSASWTRFVDALIASFRQPRSPFKHDSDSLEEDEDDEREKKERKRPNDPAIGKSLVVFHRLFAVFLSEEHIQRFYTVAFDMAQYICRRLEPDARDVTEWLRALVHAYVKFSVHLEKPENVAAIVQILNSEDSSIEGVRRARLQLLRMGFSIEGPCPDMSEVGGFQAALAADFDFVGQWEKIKSVRTMTEQVQFYLKAIEKNSPTMDYPDLRSCPEEWKILARAIEFPENRDEFQVVSKGTMACPRCSIGLPIDQLGNLRSKSIAMAKSCCNLVLVCAEI